MANPATVDDLTKRSLRPLTDADKTVGAVLLDDVWNMLLMQKPFAEAKVGTSVSFRAVVVQILCAAVLRLLANPDGKYSESIDDYQYTLDKARSTGSLYLSDAELALIGDDSGTSSGAYTIVPGGSPRGEQPSTFHTVGTAAL
jgi:hypothetical protein